MLFHEKSYPFTSLLWGERDRKATNTTADIETRVVTTEENSLSRSKSFYHEGLNKESFKKENSDNGTKYLKVELICKEDKSCLKWIASALW